MRTLGTILIEFCSAVLRMLDWALDAMLGAGDE